MVRLIVDENCDFAVVRALPEDGLDVIAVSETSPRATDDAVIQLAVRDRRILITEDKDFGQLAHASGRAGLGVVLVRFPARARKALPQAVLRVVRDRGEGLREAFVVVQPGRVRIRRGPRLI